MPRLFKNGLTGWHALAMIVAFFGVIFAVNGVMTWVALSTFSGIETENAYQKGREYNRTLAAAEAQDRLNWTVSLKEFFAPGRGGTRAAVDVHVRHAIGTPVTDLAGDVTFWRPVVDGQDRTVTLNEKAPGLYRAEAVLPQAGQWELRVNFTRADGTPYYLEKRIWVPEEAVGG